MKKLNILIMLLVLLTLVGCNETNKKQKEDEKEVEESKEEIVNEVDKKVEETLKNMTLDEKIGQLMIVFYTKDEMDNTLKSALNDVQPGGFILFKDNITTYEKTLNFIKDIKSNVKIPMFMSIDQEGGNVQRLKKLNGVTVSDVPYMYDVGTKNDLDLTYSIGKLIAEELRVIGVNMDFAPVLDVFSNPNNKVIGKRSFGSDKELVAKHGITLAKGLEDNGVIAVYKHFPGHGNTATDSHEALPILDLTKEELEKIDVYPFKEAIKNNASVIMVGHLAVPKVTEDNIPASLSKKLITDYLKKELGYKGLVVTDALNMGALTNYYSDSEICGKAVEAGVDMLLMPKSSRTCLKSVQEAVKKGTITEEQINESVRKILKLKYEKIENSYNEYLDKSYLNSQEHQDIINKIKE